MKWLVVEPESSVFRAEIERWPRLVASALLEIEALRFGARSVPPTAAEAAALLAGVVLSPIDEDVVRAAARVSPPFLRSLDAIHLAAALAIQDDVGAFFTYDHDLAQAAREHGFDVRSPGAETAPPHG